MIHTCRSGFVIRVKLLLRYKADCSIANGKNELPIHRAASSDKNIEVRQKQREGGRGGGREGEREREREREKRRERERGRGRRETDKITI